MVTAAELRERLRGKLQELFQLDQPDLGFGFYKIMHAKSEEVGKFINEDLLKDVEAVFGKIDETQKAKLKANYEEMYEQAKGLGAPDPNEAPLVKAARSAYEDYKSSASAEVEVYDHLLRFFSRYYETGDFISRRYYARETVGKAAPFAIPYNGEEVKLHWANADQYYIKSTDYFSNYTFDLRKVNENRELLKDEKLEPLRVHFRITDATEGEHGNIKGTADNKRFFLLHEANPATWDENGELVINFEYRLDPEKTGQDKTWQERRNADTVALVLKHLDTVKEGSTVEYLSLLSSLAPTEKKPERKVLAKYIEQYTARNTMDFFIHKNLGEFLRRELDFYIKNEVLRLDDIEENDAPTILSYLEKVKVVRRIAGKLIDFLAQLEDFQKKLWLKKKFVLETNYCFTLDRIPEELYPEIADNKAQHDEWVELFAINEIEGNLTSPSYSKKLSVEFLKANDKLVLDTKHFDANFKARLIASINNFDEKCDGLLIHSENFQALNLMRERHRGQISYTYIDPPYNTNEASFIYKNGYKHSSWGSMIYNSVLSGKPLLRENGVISVAIDDLEQPFLAAIFDSIFGQEKRLGNLVVEIKPSGRTNDNFLATSHEYILFYSSSENVSICFFELTEEQNSQYAEADGKSAYKWRDFLRTGGYSTPQERPNSFYPIYYDKITCDVTLEEKSGYEKILPIDSEGRQRVWRKTPPAFFTHLKKGEIKIVKNREGKWKVQIIDRIKSGTRPKSVWVGKKYDAASHGTKLLKQLFCADSPFSFPKSVHAVYDCVYIVTGDTEIQHTILDYFAGSGTTGHAVINLNREDEGNRKYILVEMGHYFNTVLKPRIAKVVYAKDWRNGKPVSRDTGVSHCFKYIRLESYEDTLNNLRFDDAPGKSKLIRKSRALREDYMLRYMLDVETRGSQSLLNIDAFNEPEKYLLNVKKANSDEYVKQAVDLLETFNYLIGLRVEQIQATQRFNAKFIRIADPDVPEDQQKKLAIDGSLKQNVNGTWSFHTVYGWVPKNPGSPNDGLRDKVLIVWRNLTGDIEKDNAVLDEWFRNNRIHPCSDDFDTIYVNGSNNLPIIKRDEENWKVQLIEEEFAHRMWDVETI